MKNLECEAEEVEYVWRFPLGGLRQAAFLHPMHCQWTIADTRRERFETVIDDYLGRPMFRR
jgi:hypothetical protein